MTIGDEGPRYWVMKSEPDVYGFHHLRAEPGGATHWDGVRNFQARNNMRAQRVGDPVLFYHSNAAPPAVVGVAHVVREAYPDHTAWDPDSRYFDPRSTPESPRWYMTDIAAVRELPRPVGLPELREHPAMEGSRLTAKGNRLSVLEITEAQFRAVLDMAEAPAPG